MPILRRASTTVLPLLLLVGTQARAGVALTTLQRQLSILLQLGPDLFPQQTVDGPASGPFSHTLADSAVVNGHRVTVSAEQNSTYSLSGGGIQFFTTTHTSVAGSVASELSNAHGESDFVAAITTDVPLNYELHASLGTEPAADAAPDAAGVIQLSVSGLGDRGAYEVWYTVNGLTSQPLDQSGVLTPGPYWIAITNFFNSGGTPTATSASLAFTATPVSGTSVPIPPAFSTGLAVLLAFAAVSYFRPRPAVDSGKLAACFGGRSR